MLRTGVLALLGVLVVAALLGLNAAAASSEDHGRFASTVVSGPACTSPVGVCTAGTLTGGLKGSFAFTGTSLIPSVDTPTTGVLLYTGDISIHTDRGDLLCKDAGAFETTGDGAVSSVCEIIGGTGEFAGASGQIQFVGNFTFAAGGTGEYRALIETP